MEWCGSHRVSTTSMRIRYGSGGVTTVVLNAPGQGVQGLHGTIDVENPYSNLGSITKLVIDDTGDSMARHVWMDDASLFGLAPDFYRRVHSSRRR